MSLHPSCSRVRSLIIHVATVYLFAPVIFLTASRANAELPLKIKKLGRTMPVDFGKEVIASQFILIDVVSACKLVRH